MDVDASCLIACTVTKGTMLYWLTVLTGPTPNTAEAASGASRVFITSDRVWNMLVF